MATLPNTNDLMSDYLIEFGKIFLVINSVVR